MSQRDSQYFQVMITSSPNNCTVLMRPEIVHYSKKALLPAARKAAFLPPQYTKKS